MDTSILAHNVKCISERTSLPKQIKKGDDYVLDLRSVHMDSDGDAYGMIYTKYGEKIGNMMLKHFCSTMC